MAVWAHWSKVTNRIDLSLSSCLRKLNKVMHVDEPIGKLAVSSTKIYVAHAASGAVVFDAPPSGLGITFVLFQRHLLESALEERFGECGRSD